MDKRKCRFCKRFYYEPHTIVEVIRNIETAYDGYCERPDVAGVISTCNANICELFQSKYDKEK